MSEPNLKDYPTILAFVGDKVTMTDISPASCANDLARLAKCLGREVHGTVRDIEMHAQPGDTRGDVFAPWQIATHAFIRSDEWPVTGDLEQSMPIVSTPEDVAAYAESVLGALAYVDDYRIQVITALLSNPNVEPRLPREEDR